MKIRFNIVGYTDRRGVRELESARAIEQRRADQAIERRYRENLRNNWKERARVTGVPRAWLSPEVAKQTPSVLRRQAD